MTALDESAFVNQQVMEVGEEDVFPDGKVLSATSTTQPGGNMESDLISVEEGKSVSTGHREKSQESNGNDHDADDDDDGTQADSVAGQKRRRPGVFRYPSDLSAPDFNSCSSGDSSAEEAPSPAPAEAPKETIDGMDFSSIMSAADAAMASTTGDEWHDDQKQHMNRHHWQRNKNSSRTSLKESSPWEMDTTSLEDHLGRPPRHDNNSSSAVLATEEPWTPERLQSLFEDSSSDNSKVIVFEEDDSASDFSFIVDHTGVRQRALNGSSRSNSSGRDTVSSAAGQSKGGQGRPPPPLRKGSARVQQLKSTHPATIPEEMGAFSSSPPIAAPKQKVVLVGSSATAMAAAAGARRASTNFSFASLFESISTKTSSGPNTGGEGELSSQRSMSQLQDPVMVSEPQRMPVTSAARRDFLMEIANDMDGWSDDENDEEAPAVRESQHEKVSEMEEKVRDDATFQQGQESTVNNKKSSGEETIGLENIGATSPEENNSPSAVASKTGDLIPPTERQDDWVSPLEKSESPDGNTPVQVVRSVEHYVEDVSTLSDRAGSMLLSEAGSRGEKAQSLLASYLESTGHSPEDAAAVASSFATLQTNPEATDYLRPKTTGQKQKDIGTDSVPPTGPTKEDIRSQLEEHLTELPSKPRRAVSEQSKYSFQFSLDEQWKNPPSSPKRAVSSQSRFSGKSKTSFDERWKNPTSTPTRNVSGQSRFSARSRSSGKSQKSSQNRWDFKSTCGEDCNNDEEDDDEDDDECDSSVLLETVPVSSAPGLEQSSSSPSIDWAVDSPRVKDDFLRRLRQKEDFMYANRRPPSRRTYGRQRRASLGSSDLSEESTSKHYRRLSDDTNTRSRDCTNSDRSDAVSGQRRYLRASEPGAVHLNTRPFGQIPAWSSSLRGDRPAGNDEGVAQSEDNEDVYRPDHPVEATIVADDSELGGAKRGTSSEVVMAYAERMPPAIKLVVNDPTFRRVCPLIIALCSVVASAVVAVVATGQPTIAAAKVDTWGTVEATMTPTSAPSTSNSPTVNIDPLLDIISSYSDVNVLNAVGTPQNSALMWLAHTDQLSVVTNEPALVQRFAMATIYFATSEGNGWLFDDDWLHPWTHECTWGRIVECVTVDDFRFVRSLSIDANTLQGTIPSEIGLLTRLAQFSISENSVRGTIPDEICKLTSLNKLDLSSNNIWGTLPECIPDARGLVQLDVSQNLIDGGLPESYSKLIALEQLDLSQTDLTGTIPKGVCDLVRDGSLALLEVDTAEVECGCCEQQEG